MPACVFTGIKKDQIGPGQYELKDQVETNKDKGTSWHKYSANRGNSVNVKVNNVKIGPGSYNVQDVQLP